MCLPLVSTIDAPSLPQPSLSARMFLHVSPTCLPVRSGCSGRMILHLSPHLAPTCLLPSGCSARMISHLLPACLRLSPTCPPARSRCSARVIFPCVSDLSPLVSHLSPTRLWMFSPHDFTFALVSACLLPVLH